MSSDPHSGPVDPTAWAADNSARQRGRVEIFNATRPKGLDGWTMDLTQYELIRGHIIDALGDAGPNGLLLKDLIDSTQARLSDHPAFPKGRLRNYTTYTKVDLEARELIARLPKSSPQRVRLRS